MSGKIKKAITGILILTVIVFGAAVTGTFAGYKDLSEGSWSYDAVKKMSDAGIVKGYPDGSFKPSEPVTYAEFIKMAVVEHTGIDDGNSESGHWALNYYNRAIEKGLFTKEDISADRMNQKIPRKYMALIAANTFGNDSMEAGEFEKIYSYFSDIDSGTEYGRWIARAVGFGIITGYEDCTFRPDNSLTRAEAATVIYRLTDENAGKFTDFEKKPETNQTSAEKTGLINIDDSEKYLLKDLVRPYRSAYTGEIYTPDGMYDIYGQVKYYVIDDKNTYNIEIGKDLTGADSIYYNKTSIYKNNYSYYGFPYDEKYKCSNSVQAVVITDEYVYNTSASVGYLPNKDGITLKKGTKEMIDFEYIGLFDMYDESREKTMVLIPSSAIPRVNEVPNL